MKVYIVKLEYLFRGENIQEVSSLMNSLTIGNERSHEDAKANDA